MEIHPLLLTWSFLKIFLSLLIMTVKLITVRDSRLINQPTIFLIGILQMVTNMPKSYMIFVGSAKFNQDSGSWDTSNVTDMTSRWIISENSASRFNIGIGSWNTTGSNKYEWDV